MKAKGIGGKFARIWGFENVDKGNNSRTHRGLVQGPYKKALKHIAAEHSNGGLRAAKDYFSPQRI